MNKTLDLFQLTLEGPPGFHYQDDFISLEEERALIGHIRKLTLQPFQFGAYEGKRRVASFGSRYDYALRKVETAPDPPEWVLPFIARIGHLAGGASQIRQVLCTEYDQGVGIGWHRDKPHYGDVFGLSLASPCRFRFRRQAGDKWRRLTLEVLPRSLYWMSGEARQLWEHSIPPVPAARYSLTFRTLANPIG